MSTQPYLFANKLEHFQPGIPVWIVDSPANRTVVEKLWKERPGVSHLEGITIFEPADTYTAEQTLLAHLDTIELHHGEYSASPPYSALEVICVSLTEDIRAALHELRFKADDTETGFHASRTPYE